MYRRSFKFPGTTTRAGLPFKLISAHIITRPPLYAVVGWTVGSKCLSPLRRHTRMRPSTFRRQNLDSSEKRTRDHCCRFHLPCRAQSWRLRALWRWESWDFLAGTELIRSSNFIPASLHRDATCTWFPLLSQHSLQTRAIHKASPCYSDCNVSVFVLGCNLWSSRSWSVRNSPRCSMNIMTSNNGATMNVELVSNILWVNVRLYTTQSPGSFFIKKFSQSTKRFAFAIITLTIQMRFWWN